MQTITAILVFSLGTAIGSFISVVIYRLHSKKKGIILSHSICSSCNKKLKWRHLIPIFSWLFLKGKCAYCGKKVSSHYLFLELFTGIIFLITFINWNFIQSYASITDITVLNYHIDWMIFQHFIYYIIVFSFLVVIFFYDLLYKEIPDKISIPAIGLAIAGGLVFGIPGIANMFIGAGIIFGFFALQFFISKGKWIGGGDLRLGALMGLILGWETGILALILSYIIGSIISIILLVQGKVTKKSAIPFGPFLVMGTLIAVFYGKEIINWYLALTTLS